MAIARMALPPGFAGRQGATPRPKARPGSVLGWIAAQISKKVNLLEIEPPPSPTGATAIMGGDDQAHGGTSDHSGRKAERRRRG
jgi:hypothetical protein